MVDLTIGLIVYGVILFILWMSTCDDQKMSKQWKHPLGIFVRTALLISVLYLVFLGLGLSVLHAYFFILIVGFLLFEVGLVVCWLFYEWVFWFPSRSEVILSTSSEGVVLVEASPEAQKRGIALSDLRPLGCVEIDGKQYQAKAALGFILKGETIEVEGDDGFELKVRKSDDNKSSSPV